MKNMILLVFVLASAAASGQHVRESVLSLKRKFTPLWGKTSSVMVMSLNNDFNIGERDSVYSFHVSVTETEMEVQSLSVGFSSFSAVGLLGFGGNSGATSSVNRQNGSVALSKTDFLAFYKCINDVYKATGAVGLAYKNSPNTVCTCSVSGIEFGGEYLPGKPSGNDQKYYFRLNEAVFSMSKLDFEEIVKFVREVKLVYEIRG